MKIDKKNNTINIKSYDINGILSITDTEKFENTLSSGIGRSKAFGFGAIILNL